MLTQSVPSFAKKDFAQLIVWAFCVFVSTLCTTVREFYEMCANCQQGIQHARRTRLPRVHERERLKCSLCASAVCPPCLLHIKRNVASAYEMYGWNVSVFMRWNVAQARSCCCCMCPLYGSPCLVYLLWWPAEIHALQMSFKLWLFFAAHGFNSLLIRSPPHAQLQIVRSRSSLYLSKPQSIFQRLGRSQANWRNCYWFSVFVSAPHRSQGICPLEYSHHLQSPKWDILINQSCSCV